MSGDGSDSTKERLFMDSARAEYEPGVGVRAHTKTATISKTLLSGYPPLLLPRSPDFPKLKKADRSPRTLPAMDQIALWKDRE